MITVSEQTIHNCDRFKIQRLAKTYPSEYRETHKRDCREKDAIMRCLKYIPNQSHVLDFPCGTGRLIRILQDEGFRVSGADGSSAMLDLAKENNASRSEFSESTQFYKSDVFNSGFKDNEFDAVICNRLFHHFNEENARRKALVELARISKGPVIVSFFNAFSASMTIKRLHKKMRGKKLVDRVPVSMVEMAEAGKAAGLEVRYQTATHWGISPHWYIVFD